MRIRDTSGTLPRLCFIGSMAGRTPGHITQQGQVLCDLFAREGYPVISASGYLNRYLRMLHMVVTILVHRRRVDVVILEIYGGRSFVVEDLVSLLCSILRLPVVMWLHGGALPVFMERFPRWTRRVFQRTITLVTPTEFLSRATAKQGFHSRIIPNVIDLPEYSYRNREHVKPRLFWMRSFHDLWNPLLAVRVLETLRAEYKDANLVMAGADKGMQEQVRSYVETRGLNHCVRFPGFLDQKGKNAEGAAADIFINTNRVDNTPIAILEACAMGLPVVSTNVGGIPDLLTPGNTGLLVPDNDHQAMVQAIRQLLENSEQATLLSRNGRSLAEKFSWKQVQPCWDKLFAELRKQKKQAGFDYSRSGQTSNSRQEATTETS